MPLLLLLVLSPAVHGKKDSTSEGSCPPKDAHSVSTCPAPWPDYSNLNHSYANRAHAYGVNILITPFMVEPPRCRDVSVPAGLCKHPTTVWVNVATVRSILKIDDHSQMVKVTQYTCVTCTSPDC